MAPETCDLALAPGGLAQHRGDPDHAHARSRPPRRGRADAGAPGVVVAELQRGVRAAGRAVRVAAHLELGEGHRQGVVDQQAAGERVADAEQHLDGLVGLDVAHHAAEHAEHAGLAARGRHVRRRRLGEEAAVAGALVGQEHRRVALEAQDARVDQRRARHQRGVVQQVARREVVGAVDDHVVVGDQVEDVVLVHPERVDVDRDVGVQRLDRDPAPTRPCASPRGRWCG